MLPFFNKKQRKFTVKFYIEGLAPAEKRYLTDDEYAFIFQRVPRLCLDFAIIKDNQILLAQREIDPLKGCWHLPGGMVRYKENVDQAAERILKSELGAKPLSKKFLGYMEFPNEINEHGIPVHSVSIVFLTELASEEISRSKQAHRVKFFSDLPEYIHPIHAKFIQQNRESLNIDIEKSM